MERREGRGERAGRLLIMIFEKRMEASNGSIRDDEASKGSDNY